jgi:hypothetical protein
VANLATNSVGAEFALGLLGGEAVPNGGHLIVLGQDNHLIRCRIDRLVFNGSDRRMS